MWRAVCVVALMALAGCADDQVADEAAETAGMALEGVVVTEAIVPVAGAQVTVAGQDLATTTDEDGRFAISPVDEGTYRLLVEAEGYADAEVTAPAAFAGGEVIKVVMVAVSSNVPYHEVEHFVGYIECSVGFYVEPPGGQDAPCIGLIDLVTGVTVSQDVWMFQWSVNAPGLRGVLIEAVWEAQATGDDMGILLRNVAGAGSGVDAGGTNIDTQYASNSGTSPMRTWVHQGIENPGADAGARFQDPQNESMDYNLMILGRTDRSEPVGYHLLLQHETEIFLTKFYHAIGDESYTVL